MFSNFCSYSGQTCVAHASRLKKYMLLKTKFASIILWMKAYFTFRLADVRNNVNNRWVGINSKLYAYFVISCTKLPRHHKTFFLNTFSLTAFCIIGFSNNMSNSYCIKQGVTRIKCQMYLLRLSTLCPGFLHWLAFYLFKLLVSFWSTA